ncbi:MAG: biosynthetic peptidoglycan transglycosylase, partial [Myxococcota bacterium]|nr:biosynthetic peptidoglycan transglycosylase [Myxococcota bacterium]
MLGSLMLMLGLGAVWGLQWAKERLRQELSRRAASFGWEIELAHVELSWSSVKLLGLEGRGAAGSTLRIERIEFAVSWFDLLEQLSPPSHVRMSGLELFLRRDELAEMRAHRAERASSPSSTGGTFPQLIIDDAHIVVMTESELGVLGLDAERLVLEREDDVFTVLGQAELELEQRYPVQFQVQVAPSRSWGSVSAKFEEGVEWSHPELGALQLGAVEVAGTPSNLHGHVGQLWLEPPVSYGVSELSIERIDFALQRAASGMLEAQELRIDGPHAVLQLSDALQGPLGQRYPELVKLLDQASLKLLGRRLSEGSARTDERLAMDEPAPVREKKRKRKKKQQRPPAPLLSASGDDISAKFVKILDALPPMSIENGVLEVQLWDDERVTLRGLGFDTRQLEESASRRLQFGVQMRGATARISIDESVAGSWPRTELTLAGITLSDVFDLLSLPAPPELSGLLDLHLALLHADHSGFEFEVGAALHQASFFHPKVSEKPIRDIDAALSGRLRFEEAADLLALEELELRSGPISLSASLVVERLRSDPRIQFEVSGEKLRCEDIPKAIPEGALTTITDLRIGGGEMSPRIYGSVTLSKLLGFTMKAEGFPGECEILSVAPHDVEGLAQDDYRFVQREYTTLSEGIELGPASDDYAPIDTLPGYLIAAMFLTEDAGFYNHGGIKVGLINRAIRLNLNEGRYVYGGSTISQQLVKNLFLSRRKTLSRKLDEVFIVWRLESVLSKDRILELYLNCIEFGPDVYGVVQASRFYFDTTPERLSPLQAAYLASLKVAPRHGGKFYLRGFPQGGRWWNKRQKYILVVLAENGYISPAEVLASYPWI